MELGAKSDPDIICRGKFVYTEPGAGDGKTSEDAAMEIVGDKDEPEDSRTLRMSGDIPRKADGSPLLPSKTSVQDKLCTGRTRADNPVVVYVDVKNISSERNFPYLHVDPKNPCHLSDEHVVYVEFKTAEQANHVIAYFGGARRYTFLTEEGDRDFAVKFARTTKPKKVRQAYSQIGPLVKRLNDIHADLHRVGAITGHGGLPQLPARFVDPDEFDKQVQVYQSLLAHDKHSRYLHDLHHYLVYHTRIDRSVLQPQIDSLVMEKVQILLDLSKYNQHLYPFKYIREYNPLSKDQ